MLTKTKNKIKGHIKKVLDIQNSPHQIALGFAIGSAIAILPTFGLGALIGLIIILIFKKINKISLFLAFVFWNPLLLIPMAFLSYYIGNLLFKTMPVINLNIEILNQIITFSRRFLIGNLIVTAVFTILSYLIVFYLVKNYQKKKFPFEHPPEIIKEIVNTTP